MFFNPQIINQRFYKKSKTETKKQECFMYDYWSTSDKSIPVVPASSNSKSSISSNNDSSTSTNSPP